MNAPFSTYAETLTFLDSLDISVMKLGTDRIQRVLNELENPQDTVKSIHIVGTNGKGSVSATLSTIYTQAGYHTGMFTSPHLVDIRERIQLNGQPVSEAVFLQVAIAVFPAMTKALPDKADWLTYFEYLSLMAFWLFADCAVDVAIIEAGLGGRLDSTNVMAKPEIIVVTPISLDHMDRLGPTRASIAREKAGVFRPDVLVLTVGQPESVLTVLKEEAQQHGSILTVIDNARWSTKKMVVKGNQAYRIIETDIGEYRFCLLGRYQVQNLALVLQVVKSLQVVLPVSENDVQSALTQVHWPGRFQYLPQSQLIINGSHNEAGIDSLLETLQLDFPDTIIHWGITLLANRSTTLIRPLLDYPQTASVQFLAPPPGQHAFHSPRDFQPVVTDTQLAKNYVYYEKSIQAFASLPVTPGELKILTGSLYTAGHIQPELDRLYPRVWQNVT